MKLRFFYSILLATVGLAILTASLKAQAVIAPPGRHVAREPIEWIRLWLPNVNRKDLPQVLLLGDSITQAYYKDVAVDLKGKAYVGYLTSSLSVGDPMLPQQIGLVLKNYRFDVIHFNNGLHGKGYTEREYARYFPQFVKAVKANSHGAKLIWTSSTPVRTGKNMSEFAPWTSRVAIRNRIAADYVRKAGIPIDDLYAAVLHHPEYYLGVDGTHPNAEGRAAEAHDVAASILKILGKLGRQPDVPFRRSFAKFATIGVSASLYKRSARSGRTPLSWRVSGPGVCLPLLVQSWFFDFCYGRQIGATPKFPCAGRYRQTTALLVW